MEQKEKGPGRRAWALAFHTRPLHADPKEQAKAPPAGRLRTLPPASQVWADPNCPVTTCSLDQAQLVSTVLPQDRLPRSPAYLPQQAAGPG